jgi:hypothetical protein
MTTDEFRRRAADCLRWAQEAANERTKGLWLNMAQVWLDRAQSPQDIGNARVQAARISITRTQRV